MFRVQRYGLTGLAALIFLAGCGAEKDRAGTKAPAPAAQPSAPTKIDASEPAVLSARAASLFGVLPKSAPNRENPTSEAKVELGRMLYFDERLSKNQDISCNSCHPLDRFGVDGEPTSPGHKGQRGARNSPTTLNAALHFAQFWDGRAKDVEAQAKGPVLNPVEMALSDEAAVTKLLRSIPGYRPLFAAAFPGKDDPVTFDNMARAIGSFERKLLTPGPFDDFMVGDASALDASARRGLSAFITAGCPTCHNGPTLGGRMYQKLGLVKPYPTQDAGRFDVTANEADRGFFKVPSLRNVAETAPYLHDGSIATLEEVVRVMAAHQLGIAVTDEQVTDIVAFLGSLTGKVDPKLTAAPKLPESGPDTPGPDPS